MNTVLAAKRNSIISLCNKYSVAVLYVFGSSVKTDDNNDFDFLVRFKVIPLKNYADYYFGLKEDLELLLNKKVDLIEEQTVNNPYLKTELEATKEMVYG